MLKHIYMLLYFQDPYSFLGMQRYASKGFCWYLSLSASLSLTPPSLPTNPDLLHTGEGVAFPYIYGLLSSLPHTYMAEREVLCFSSTRCPLFFPYILWLRESGLGRSWESLRTAYNACFLNFSIDIVDVRDCNHYILCNCT